MYKLAAMLYKDFNGNNIKKFNLGVIKLYFLTNETILSIESKKEIRKCIHVK